MSPAAAVTRLLLVSGSTRDLSTNRAALRTARDVVPAGTEAVRYDGLQRRPEGALDADPPAPRTMRGGRVGLGELTA